MFSRIRFLAGGLATTTLVVICLFVLPALSQAQPAPQILSTSPIQNELDVSASTDIMITFDIDMDETTINGSSFIVNAISTGKHDGAITYDPLTKTATMDPDGDFAIGEVVSVVLTTDVQSVSGIPLSKSLFWSFTVHVLGGPGVFEVHWEYPTDEDPVGIYGADFDNDGDIDLATANEIWWAGSISVLLNEGNGTFAPRSDYPLIDVPRCLTAADLDQDGDIDLATGTTYEGNIWILLNDGDGTFSSPFPVESYPTAFGPFFLSPADLDGDGDIDLVAALWDAADAQILVFLNRCDGTFVVDSLYTAGTDPRTICTGDCDNDGDVDIMAAGYNSLGNIVSVLLNQGNGTFTSPTPYTVNYAPTAIIAAELNADGDLDIVTADINQPYSISVLLGIGDGTFPSVDDYPNGSRPIVPYAADVDADGDIDIVAANVFDQSVSILLNSGVGAFPSYSVFAVGDKPTSISAADFDGDGDLDLATANKDGYNVSILMNAECDCSSFCDLDGVVGITPVDVVIVVNLVYLGLDGRTVLLSCPGENGDWNCDGNVNPVDVVWYVNYVYLTSGVAPCDPCTCDPYPENCP